MWENDSLFVQLLKYMGLLVITFEYDKGRLQRTFGERELEPLNL